MKQIIKLSIMLVLVFSTAACSAQPNAQQIENGGKKVAAGERTMDEIKNKGVLTIAVDDTFPPMNYRNEKNELIGFDIDLAKAVSKELGVKAEFVPTAWDGILPGLDAGRYDMIMSSMNITEERKQKVDFVEYLQLGQIVAVGQGNPYKINSKDNLSGKIVGVQMGSTSETAAKEIKGVKEIKAYNGYTDVFNDLALGRVQGVIVAEAVGRYYKKLKPGVFDVSGNTFMELPIGIAVRKNDDSLENALQNAVNTLKENGTFSEISDKWFGEDITQKQ
ncbi:ABC transporter substrate-binding protein [Bacillus sp. B-jedd]|uniref:ABC transporter substrate-binding protein n=1 Tax=Bacillus sp. B-jedd TaxID=1476857 RepID=UPI000515705F|nr:ABC transporter substrate-binding protein [Bacillus sp. B-jedd]CEG27489.1 amino acid ABC transporter, amino acid-binding protein [Bacillus sp. B-jedd]